MSVIQPPKRYPTSHVLLPTELSGNIGPSLLTLGPDMGRALKKLAKRMLMATPTGLEPVASTVTGWRDTRHHQGAKYIDL